ncbi:MAG: tRNA (adenosine(37)-N6)-dimethylallyltransferase MiaA [Pseudanabaena sp. M135S2SP2A07QC]|nr:tRNA (adenosine(37)-N6)-dimethylallyltransferase MiaA [Pseudanabaena sp. M090S1SP2A07QC]MCA6507251.1 tRNA (adenosine(37)-N6)-dimethylallyltransferase MiaA [Pseudanabaena sp. M172S2SP2A07QC]MCA6509233.1 tRNA (adenosine(37)-N6)-dimethylallyltransferase MiaA [Pseudanabaena sp. M109S1SP2A07QC]MCA6526946.1 tRNA (adenosine(37)-N6)-dimethylallyltransferase MiaA [Pseudanabaena sp. M179S2SP2A07QC]MCA6532312.1 tRNA (adenosine(37)-N6)-dimethylallyltransferase MiaA [Pseudanabaena sp. M125S2SP2A07QC]MCA
MESIKQPVGLIVILGATATGKTSLAIALAKQLNAPILSADSRQVYRHLDIGTAKPTIEERQGVPHYLIDIIEPDQTLTLADYQSQAQTLIAKFHAQGVTPILVGGSGLYIKAITAGLKIPRVAPQPELRSQFAELGQTYCYQILQQVDPVGATKIHANDQIRTLRSLEVFYVTGQPLSTQQGEQPPSYPILQIGLDCEDLDVYRKLVSDRTEQMLEDGWLDEIRDLQNRYGSDLPHLRTLGYGEMSDYLADKTDLETAKLLTITHTCQFAKRQRTWFRGSGNGDLAIHWLRSGSSWKEAIALLSKKPCVAGLF